MLNNIAPNVGTFLIAEPFMNEPNFKRSVVLITAADDNEGHVGYVLNQKSGLFLQDIVFECPNAEHQIFIGGPVQTDTLHYIHSCSDKIFGGEEVGENLYWGGDFEALKYYINKNEIGQDQIKFFMGYAGWGVHQLEAELKENSWIVSDKINPAIVYDFSDIDLWKEAIINLGQKFAHVANFPINPGLN